MTQSELQKSSLLLMWLWPLPQIPRTIVGKASEAQDAQSGSLEKDHGTRDGPLICRRDADTHRHHVDTARSRQYRRALLWRLYAAYALEPFWANRQAVALSQPHLANGSVNCGISLHG